ncbi:5'-methylthioadenosine/S-adenosylhomocysteine nucleosidase [Alteromonas sp. KUL49]|uniref:5'-methylthioadenosine/S-adenosylhomocysteine nucleosidase n=1 Tax=Alteromonas sp. KUL49 TaxID=2480798 RepID=UPI00102F0D08|nr:5'-methylthioadenosine/S-adenosylhomocysteine nucleosidase [Alteromonas sp. KUL49]TAP42357.1 purine phosphorylase [Alteromonas sp. KUL49]GEA09972.1 phosphorylase [Alteromonas sp. KUL49]
MRKALILFSAVCIIALSGCVSTQPNYGPQQFSGEGLTAVVVAYEPEMEGILARIDSDPDAAIHTTLEFKGVKYRLGTYNDEPIVVFATGMSIANAAMTMQMALDYFPVKQVVYMGIAGAINPEWHPGDVIVPARWYYHDESVYSNEDPNNPGSYILPDYYQTFLSEQEARRALDPHTPHYKPFKFIHPDEVLIIKSGMDKPEDTSYFSATTSLLEAASRAISTMPTQRVLDERDAKLFVGGNGVTGSVFLDNRDYRQWTRDVFNAEVTEMESAAIGQVCTINEVDWVIVRAISDLAGGQEGVNVENKYDKEVSRIGAEVLFALLDELAK